MNSKLIATLAPLGVVLFAHFAVAEAAAPDPRLNRECAARVTECFTYGMEERAGCFLLVSRHSVCEHVELGGLAGARALAENEAIQSPPAFSGPQLVDRSCLSAFDSQLSAALLAHPEVQGVDLKALGEKLSGCKRRQSYELLRP